MTAQMAAVVPIGARRMSPTARFVAALEATGWPENAFADALQAELGQSVSAAAVMAWTGAVVPAPEVVDAAEVIALAGAGSEVEVDRRCFVSLPLALAAAGRGAEDEWEVRAEEAARDFYSRPPSVMVRTLAPEMDQLRRVLARDGYPRGLCRAGARLSTVMALAVAAVAAPGGSVQWWRAAVDLADRAGDPATSAWVMGWEATNATYEGRPLLGAVSTADRAVSAGGVSAGVAGALAASGQARAVLGDRDGALAALDGLRGVADRLPAAVVADSGSMLGWPEVRTVHTASYVYTSLGMTREAYQAQEQALRLYPESLRRERAQMSMHTAACLVRDGDLAGGVAWAHRVLDETPASEWTAFLRERGMYVYLCLPERSRRVGVDLRDRLAA